MSSTYKPQHSTYPPPTTSNPPTWPEQQASTILSLRDVSTQHVRTPGPDVRDLDPDRQIHARWTDPDLVRALTRLQESLPPNVHLALKYGGRDVTAATWITVHQVSPGGPGELEYVLWFHEYDDLDVEVGELRGVKWGAKKGEGEGLKKEVEDGEGRVRKVERVAVKVEDVDVDVHG